MSDCQRARELIQRLVKGTLSGEQERQLNGHAEACQDCRDEIRRATLIGEVIGDAFAPQTAAAQARMRVLAAVPESPEAARTRIARRLWTRRAAAAAVLLAAGLVIGLAVNRPSRPGSPNSPPLLQVAMRVSELEGTVLVRHRGSDLWQPAKPNAPVYLGDTFHPTARSAVVLRLGEKSTIRLDQNSMLALTSHNGKTQFFLEHGECTASLESPHRPFFIRTPHGRVEALGTEFTVSVE